MATVGRELPPVRPGRGVCAPQGRVPRAVLLLRPAGHGGRGAGGALAGRGGRLPEGRWRAARAGGRPWPPQPGRAGGAWRRAEEVAAGGKSPSGAGGSRGRGCRAQRRAAPRRAGLWPPQVGGRLPEPQRWLAPPRGAAGAGRAAPSGPGAAGLQGRGWCPGTAGAAGTLPGAVLDGERVRAALAPSRGSRRRALADGSGCCQGAALPRAPDSVLPGAAFLGQMPGRLFPLSLRSLVERTARGFHRAELTPVPPLLHFSPPWYLTPWYLSW